MRWKKIDYNELIWKTIGSIYIQWIWKKVGYHQRIIWKCLKCWEVKEFRIYEVLNQKTTGCKCVNTKYKDLIGKKYWRLTIIEQPFLRNKRRYVKVKCDCWKEVECNLINLVNWHPASCWCLFNDVMKLRRKYGEQNIREMRIYTIWLDMQGRVKWHIGRKRYYNKWIKCERKSFEDFYKDMWESYEEHCKQYWEKDTTIDRIDWNWNYCKENCRWATYKEQYLNQEKHKVKTILKK